MHGHGCQSYVPGCVQGGDTRRVSQLVEESRSLRVSLLPYILGDEISFFTSEWEGRMSDLDPGQLAPAVIPPGFVIAYAGEVVDTGRVVEPIPGWLLCNGAALTSTNPKFRPLHIAIQASHGNGQDGQTQPSDDFNLPDYRGLFLRGTNGLQGRDPNAGEDARRENHSGGNIGNRVGSVQQDQFRSHDHPLENGSHRHDFETRNASTGGAGNSPVASDGGGGAGAARTGSVTLIVQARGGDETRPVNAYVNYLIKL